MATDINHNTAQLYRQFHQRLLLFIRSRVSDRDEAEDILHDVFLKIHRNIDSLRDEEKFEGWMFQIARNAIVDYYRSRKPDAEGDATSEIPDDKQELNASERLAPSVREFVEQLPEPYREAIRLVEFEKVSQKELAERLRISVSGAKSRVQRARAMLRDMLMRCCHFEFDRFGAILDYHPISCCCCDEHAKAG
jgi:RNA polymerase sigma-70 factor (ECF subfamily)